MQNNVQNEMWDAYCNSTHIFPSEPFVCIILSSVC